MASVHVHAVDYYAEGRYDGWKGVPSIDPFSSDLDPLDLMAYARGYRDGERSALGIGSCEHCPADGGGCAVCQCGLNTPAQVA